MLRKDIIFGLLSVIISYFILVLIFGPILKHPGGFLFGGTGDGIKNYFNFAYYLKHGNGLLATGLNYPFGEHLLFTDSHPALAWITQHFQNLFSELSNYGVAILNTAMMYSMLLAAPIIYLICRQFNLPRWYAIWIAIIITFLSPQFDRIRGHYSLSYIFWFPLIWYIIIRLEKASKKWRWAGFLTFTGFLAGTTHVYFIGLLLTFGIALAAIRLIQSRKDLVSEWRNILPLLVGTLLPFILIQLIVLTTDNVVDRPNQPFGFYQYHASFKSILLPHFAPIKFLLDQYGLGNYRWEGRSYLGLPAVFLFIFLIGGSIIHFFRGRWKLWQNQLPDKLLLSYVLAASIVLLFSMCFPFKYGFRFLTDWFPFIKQFRSVGRFAWVFYYVFGIYTAKYIWILFRSVRRRRLISLAWISLISVLGAWTLDAAVNVKLGKKGIENTNSKLESDDSEYLSRFEGAGFEVNDFQAILCLPFAGTCADKMLYSDGHTSIVEAMKCAFHTGIPIIETVSPRTSIDHSLSSIQLLSHDLIKKRRIDAFNSKYILILNTPHTPMPVVQQILDASTLFWEDKWISLHALPVSHFKSRFREAQDQANTELTRCQEMCIFPDSLPFFFEGYDDDPSQPGQTGFSIFQKRGSLQLFSSILPVLPDGYEKWDISFWTFFDSRTHGMPKLEYTILGSDQKVIVRKAVSLRTLFDVDAPWVRVSFQIEKQTKPVRLHIEMTGKYLSADNLLIKPENSRVGGKTFQEQKMFNNYLIY
jgi:hypothetical protein